MPDSLEPDETQILAAMLGISEMVGGLSDLQELLATVVRIVPQLVRSNRCVLFTFDEGKGELRCAQAFGPDIEQVKFLTKLVVKEMEIPRLAQKVLRQRLPALVRDAAKEEILPASVIQKLNLRTMLVVPLVCKQKTLGLMALDDTRGNRYFTSKEINVVLGIATMAAIAMDSTTARDEFAAERARLETITAMLCDAFLVLDAHLRIKYVNARGQELLGWKAEEIVGKPCSEVFEVVDTNGVEVCSSICPGKHILWGEDISEEVYRLNFRKKDGTRIFCEVKASAMRDPRGQITEIAYALVSPNRLPRPQTDVKAVPRRDTGGVEAVLLENK